MFLICISENAKDELQNKNINELDKIYKSLERLSNGLWKNGTRVKKLHAVNKNKCIYEARVDKARRMLFSIKSDDMSYENIEKSIIYIHNICVEHDDVIFKAKNILGNDYSENDYILEVENKINMKQLLVEEKTYKNQYEVYFYIDENKFHILTEDDYLRFFNKKNDTKKDIINFQLKLTKEQEKILKKPLPLLISGTAGSGKTTILIYKLKTKPEDRKIYITYSKELCNDAKKLFRELVIGDDHEEEYLRNTKFITFKDFLLKYKMDKIDPIMSKDRFIGIYNVYSRGNNINKNFPAMMVWEEIRGIWKSNILNGASNIMSFEEYKNLSEEVAPNFKDNRNEAYKIFIWYQNYLKENNMLDEIDMIEEYLTFENNENYSIVACDEIQDLTNMHFKLISSLCNNEPQRMLIAGDDHQIVNHSGFRWQNISNTLYKNYKCKAKISVLNTNFRNTGSIVNLANSINKLQEKFTEYRYKGTTKQSSFTGEIPKLLKNIDEECIIDKLSNLGPTQAIIVRNEQELLRLNEIFYKTFNKTPLIFTIEQVKGLEFNTVVLWRINTTLEDTKIFWQKFVRNISNNVINNNVNERCIRYESSLLYVAITRGMKKCLIYDGNEYSPVWNIKDINSNLNVINSIEDLMDKDDEVEYTEYDWFKQGKVLLNKRLYTQALQCFLRVDQSIGSDEIKKLIIKCKAEIEIENGNLEKAADLYLAMGYHEEAAECYDNAGLYDKAANIYFTKKYCSDPYPLYRRYKSKYFDSIKEWYRSAIYCKQNKDYYEAMIRYERAGRIKDAQNIQQKYLHNI